MCSSGQTVSKQQIKVKKTSHLECNFCRMNCSWSEGGKPFMMILTYWKLNWVNLRLLELLIFRRIWGNPRCSASWNTSAPNATSEQVIIHRCCYICSNTSTVWAQVRTQTWTWTWASLQSDRENLTSNSTLEGGSSLFPCFRPWVMFHGCKQLFPLLAPVQPLLPPL